MSADAPRLAAIATALPAHRYRQRELHEAARSHFGASPLLRAVLPVFETCGVDTRYLVQPVGEYLRPATLEERNDAFIAEATRLSRACLLDVLDAAGLERSELDHLVFASSTGIATPSIDALLLHDLGLRADLERTPMFGIGCAAGAVGISRAADLARARPGAAVALAAVELCSLTFQVHDLSVKNVVGAALFGDGAAAALLTTRPGPGPAVIAHRSHTFPGSTGIMGWRLTATGLELILSKELPQLVESAIEPLVSGFLAGHGLKIGDVARLAVHPGGPRVVDALERALGLGAGRLDATRRFLRDHGNLSSCSVLFLLRDLLRDPPGPGEHGLVVAFGPGFSAELVLLRW